MSDKTNCCSFAPVITEEEALEHYRRVRDEIRRFAEKLPAALRQD